MADSDFLEQRGYCGGFTYLDDTYAGLYSSEVETVIDVLKQAMDQMNSSSLKYTTCGDFVELLETMLEKAKNEWNQGCQDCR